MSLLKLLVHLINIVLVCLIFFHISIILSGIWTWVLIHHNTACLSVLHLHILKLVWRNLVERTLRKLRSMDYCGFQWVAVWYFIRRFRSIYFIAQKVFYELWMNSAIIIININSINSRTGIYFISNRNFALIITWNFSPNRWFSTLFLMNLHSLSSLVIKARDKYSTSNLKLFK